MERLARTFAWLCVSCLLWGCDVYDESLLERDGGRAPACALRHPPPRPGGADDGVDIGEITFTVRDVIFDQSGERWREIGFDLDDTCTIAPDFDTECDPPAPTATPEVDGEQGIDNTFGSQLFPTLDLAVPGLEDTSRGYQTRGVGAVLLSITDWNGQDNDPRVDVEMAITVVGARANPDGSMPNVVFDRGMPQLSDGSPVPEPLWDGTDWMWVRDDNYFDGDPSQPLIRDSNAYVAGRVLVVTLPERTDFVFPGMDIGLLVRLTDAVASMRISADNSTLDMITVGGRWPLFDLLSTAEAMGVCRDTVEYTILTNQLDRIADLRALRGSGGPGVECDAMSLGIGFVSGHRVGFAGVGPGPPLSNACDEMMRDGGTPDAGM